MLSGIAQQRLQTESNAYTAAAGQARQAAGAQVAASDYQTNRVIGSDIAFAAASGVAPGSGSAKVVVQNNASEGALKDTAIRYSGELQSASMMAAAANSRIEGRQALTGGLFGAGSTLLTAGLKGYSPAGAGGLGFNSPSA